MQRHLKNDETQHRKTKTKLFYKAQIESQNCFVSVWPQTVYNIVTPSFSKCLNSPQDSTVCQKLELFPKSICSCISIKFAVANCLLV